jgi:hypothetical protein
MLMHQLIGHSRQNKWMPWLIAFGSLAAFQGIPLERTAGDWRSKAKKEMDREDRPVVSRSMIHPPPSGFNPVSPLALGLRASQNHHF